MFRINIVWTLFLSVGVSVGFCGMCYSATPLEEHFKYVADAANQISFLVAKSADPNENAKEIAEQACKMLTQLSSDQQFKELVYKGFNPKLNSNIKETVSDLAKVNDAIDKEAQALQHIGVNHLTSIQALAAAIPLAKTIDPAKVDPETLLKDLSQLREQSCLLTTEIEKSQKRDAIKTPLNSAFQESPSPWPTKSGLMHLQGLQRNLSASH